MTSLALHLDHADAVALLGRQTELLEQIAAGSPLVDVLTGIATTLEDLVPGCSCSVLLLDHETATLRHGAAPSLPAEYSATIDGMAIGAGAGSCGTAAYTGRPAVAADIRADVRWVPYRDLADRFGLRACWSTPIRGRDGVSGTFAVYHPSPHRPTPREKHLVERLTHLASVAIDHEGLMRALSVNVLDVTGRRAAERERHKRVEAELARHAAEAANRAKTDFVSALGHELRTPLQAITGFTELLGTLDLDADRRVAALDHINAAAGHILTMVNEVLDVARIEARALPLAVVDVPVEPLVADVLAMVGPLATAERVALHTAPWVAPVCLRADRRRAKQVLLNLVANAIRYNRPDGTAVVSWAVDGTQVLITVRDTGPGIAAEHLGRLFTPFDRLGSDSEEGIGLGLPLARGLTEAMGGTLDVRSEVGEGTTVTMTLPMAG